MASSNWRRIFLVLTGQVEPDAAAIAGQDPYDMRRFRTLRSYIPAERVRRVRTYAKFLFSRHPFDRIQSAFYDRLHYPDGVDDNFKALIGTEIIRNLVSSNSVPLL